MMNEPQIIARGEYCLTKKSSTGFDVTIYKCPIEMARLVIRSASIWNKPMNTEMYDKLIQNLKEDKAKYISDFEIDEPANHKE